MTGIAALTALVLLAWWAGAGFLVPLLVVLVVVAVVCPEGPRPRVGAGASADARARALRTPLVRIATLLGISTRAGRLADRYQAGAVGERYVAGLLAPLTAEGWIVLPDRKLPRGEANVDLLAFSPQGGVYNVDAKNWSAEFELYVLDGRLFHGDRDVTGRLRGLDYETRTVARLINARVISLAVMVGTLPPGSRLRANGIRIIPAGDVCDVLRALDREYLPHQRQAALVDTAARLLPPHTGRNPGWSRRWRQLSEALRFSGRGRP